MGHVLMKAPTTQPYIEQIQVMGQGWFGSGKIWIRVYQGEFNPELPLKSL